MGSLVTQTPYSEVTAVLEILDYWGVTRENLKAFRGAGESLHSQVARLIRGEGVASGLVAERGLGLSAGVVDLSNRFQEAAQVLGSDFVSPLEISKVMGLQYSPEQLQHLLDTLPGGELLKWCRDNGFVVIAGPPRTMYFDEVVRLNANLLHANSKTRCCEFEAVGTGWLAICKEPHFFPSKEKFTNQLSVLGKDERTPNITEVFYWIALYFRVRGIRFFGCAGARAANMTRTGDQVYAGSFNDLGLLIIVDHTEALTGWPAVKQSVRECFLGPRADESGPLFGIVPFFSALRL